MKELIEAAWENRNLLNEEKTQQTIRAIIELLDKGEIRVAEPIDNKWNVNE